MGNLLDLHLFFSASTASLSALVLQPSIIARVASKSRASKHEQASASLSEGFKHLSVSFKNFWAASLQSVLMVTFGNLHAVSISASHLSNNVRVSTKIGTRISMAFHVVQKKPANCLDAVEFPGHFGAVLLPPNAEVSVIKVLLKSPF